VHRLRCAQQDARTLCYRVTGIRSIDVAGLTRDRNYYMRICHKRVNYCSIH